MPLTPGVGHAFSPDGRWVLATSRAGRDLSLIPTGPGTPQHLKGNIDVRAGRFLPDGKSVVFVGTGKDNRLYLYVQPLNGEPRVISPGGEVNGVIPSPDGATIATSVDRQACLIRIAGGPPQPLAWPRRGELPIAWSADGTALFMAQRNSADAVERVVIATGARTPWKALMPSDGAGIVGVLGIRLLDEGRAYAYSYRRVLSQLLVVSGLH